MGKTRRKTTKPEFAASETYSKDVLGRYSGIRESREYSIAKLGEIRALVARIAGEHKDKVHGVSCIAICGSFARLEGSRNSDVDVMTVAQNVEAAREFHQILLDAIRREHGLGLPNPKGVFAIPEAETSLREVAGGETESYRSLSQRMLFVLESNWLWNEAHYRKLQDDITDMYAEDVALDPRKNFVFLLNDLMRYFRTICVNYQYSKSGTEWGKWPIRNIKLRHSRVLMYFSLLLCLGQMSTYYEVDKVQRLKRLIRLPPLERIYAAYESERDLSWFRIFGFYDVFLRAMNNTAARNQLKDLEYAARYDSPVFADLKANSDGLSAEITRFILDRRQRWSDRFFEYLFI